MPQIVAATSRHLPAFFSYLSQHLAENGVDGSPLFQPQSRAEAGLAEATRFSFEEGIEIKVGEPGWRRFWLALDETDQIIGHIDLRAHQQKYSSHRAVLGMGVASQFRRHGLARRFLKQVCDWASGKGLEYIDLMVMDSNLAALSLYESSGFSRSGYQSDQFRIDGHSYGSIQMSRMLSG